MKTKEMKKQRKKFAVIANQKSYAEHIAGLLKVFFGDALEFQYYDTQELLQIAMLEEEYVLVSSFTVFQRAKEKVKSGGQILLLNLTFRKDALEPLKAIPDGTKALLVNIDYKNCMESITMIYDMGITGLEMIPYYPGCECDSSIKLAVTAGEPQLVPPAMERVIDLGHREIDANTIYRIAKIIGVENPFRNEETRKLRDNLVNQNLEIDYLFRENSRLSLQMDTLLGLMKQGILITDPRGKVYMANHAARQMLRELGIPEKSNLAEMLPGLDLGKDAFTAPGATEQLVRVQGKSLSVSVSPITASGEISGRIITLEYFEQAEDRQHKLRKKLRENQHRATYTFDQILGESPQICEAKKLAMRMALSDSSVCLYGESGTGKELFAQSIHNYSKRKDYQFVAINCAALPENLLESELYGYEEGAFSGARKGGQIGLFELAHRGTLFLDEIEEMSRKMQAKLLRAIEEQKIIRVGGRKLIDVDVRIICASNMDLKPMVEAGTFRRDLFYRLHVLPVQIPSLSKRKGDIFLLMDALKKEIGVEYTLSKEAEQLLLSYTWPGNVRELKNIAEYLGNLGKAVIEPADIPLGPVELAEESPEPVQKEKAAQEAAQDFFSDPEEESMQFILSEISRAQRENRHIGRSALAKQALQKGMFLTEAEIRRILKKLDEEGYIISYKGRKGSTITEKGLRKIGQ